MYVEANCICLIFKIGFNYIICILKETYATYVEFSLNTHYVLQFWRKFLPKELLLPKTLDEESENICRKF